MRRVSRLLQSKKGMTLVEVVIGVLLLSMITLFLLSAMVVGIKIISGGASSKRANKHAAAGIENTMGGFSPDDEISGLSRQDGAFSVNFGGADIQIGGQYVTGTGKDARGSGTYVYFDSDPD